MSQLATKLSAYYTRKNNKLIFNNALTLNRLASEMYEQLDYKQIDSSVISRVLKGERLFTVQQLKTFCNVLHINEREQKTLLDTLQADYLRKKGYVPNSRAVVDTLDVISNLIKEAFLTYYDGRCLPLERLLTIIEDYIEQISFKDLSESQKSKFYELKGFHLYLRGRLIGCTSLSDNVIPQMKRITNDLFTISEISKKTKLSAYANILLSDAYYIAGGYSSDEKKKNLYTKSIEYGKRSLPFFTKTEHDGILAMRNMAASAIYLGDEQTFNSLKKTMEEVIGLQPLENRIYTLQFCSTIAKGEAYFNHKRPFTLREKGIKHFGTSLQGAGAFAVSDLRAELETLLIMKSQEKRYMKNLLIQGSLLADHEKMARYKEYFDKIEAAF